MPSDRPLIMLDWDGVVNIDASSRRRRSMCYHHGWQQKRVEYGVRAFWNPRAGVWLHRLVEETGAELAWASRWEDYAQSRFGPLIGFPGLPYSPANAEPTKAHGVVPWTAGRPFVWLDDEEDETEPVDELAGDQPHLVIITDDTTGLTEKDIEQAREWLLALRGIRG
jgi:hypothetical protein